MEEIIITLILQALEAALSKAAEYAIKYIIKKVVDETGRVITQIIYEFDSDGDGVNDSEESIIVVSGDGTLTVYDMNGNITAEDCETAYSLWVSENGALDKLFVNYSVSEALLLFIAIGAVVGVVSKIFKRRKL